MKKVTGIGGIFFKCKDPNAIKEWYNKHLGLDAGPMGQVLNGGNWMHRIKKALPNGM